MLFSVVAAVVRGNATVMIVMIAIEKIGVSEMTGGGKIDIEMRRKIVREVDPGKDIVSVIW